MSARVLLKRAALALLALVAADVLLAQVGMRLVAEWRREELERRARAMPTVFLHGLAPNETFVHAWKGARVPYATNSLGFRDASAREVSLTSDRPRLLVLGDSFAEGVGVAFERSCVGIIAEGLGAEGIEVLDAGLQYSSPACYYRKARYWIAERGLDVDEVAVFLDLSDAYEEGLFIRIESGGEERVSLAAGVAPPWADRAGEFLRRHSVLFRSWSVLSGSSGDSQRERADPLVAMTNHRAARWTVDDELFDEFGRAGLERCRASMDELADLLEARGIPLSVVVYPWPDQILSADLESRHASYWTGWASERGVRCLNLFPLFIDGRDPESVALDHYILGDVHFSEAGHAVVARAFLADRARWLAAEEQAVETR